MRDLIVKLIHIAAAIIFPSTCVGCRTSGTLLCDDCHDKLERNDTVNDTITAALSYRDRKVRDLIWHLKYRGSKEAAVILAEFLYETILHRLSDDRSLILSREKIILLPVPTTSWRRRRRGWNQAELLTGALLALSPQSFEVWDNVLLKIRETPSQVSQRNRRERLENLKEAFALAPGAAERLQGRISILVDDVTTTGTTLAEITKTIDKSGAKPRLLIEAAAAHG